MLDWQSKRLMTELHLQELTKDAMYCAVMQRCLARMLGT